VKLSASDPTHFCLKKQEDYIRRTSDQLFEINQESGIATSSHISGTTNLSRQNFSCQDRGVFYEKKEVCLSLKHLPSEDYSVKLSFN